MATRARDILHLPDVARPGLFAQRPDGVEKPDFIGRIFPAGQAAGFAELHSEGGERLREYTNALGESAGGAECISRVQLDTLAGDVTILSSAFGGLQNAIGEALGLWLRRAVQDIRRVISGTAQWARHYSDLVLSLAAMTAVGVAAGGAIVVFGGVLSGLGTIFAAVGAVIALAGTGVGFRATRKPARTDEPLSSRIGASGNVVPSPPSTRSGRPTTSRAYHTIVSVRTPSAFSAELTAPRQTLQSHIELNSSNDT